LGKPIKREEKLWQRQNPRDANGGKENKSKAIGNKKLQKKEIRKKKGDKKGKLRGSKRSCPTRLRTKEISSPQEE